jgi:signal transduction histidine kinase/ActR/RegA family two-component response regulator
MNDEARDESASDELRRCLRDVLSLLALPASWEKLSPREILVSLAEALETSVRADVVVAQLRSAGQSEPVFRLNGVASARHPAAAEWFSSLTSLSTATIARLRCGELGELTAMYEPIGYHASQGYLLIASGHEGFPSSNEVAIIRAASTLGTTAVQMARAMRERESALRAREDFMAVLGHELRNPLAPITMALELIRHRSVEPPSREHLLIERQVNHLRRLVDDLLDVARIERGTIELKLSSVEFVEVINDAVDACAELIRDRRHQLRVDVPATGLRLLVDRFRMHQVVVNLLTNAARYSNEDGVIEIGAEAQDGRLRFFVRDNGIGIAPEFLPRIFEAFVQARRSSDASYGGLGIGLALVRTLVNLHGGSVTATSEGLGWGSRFEVEVPIHLPPAAIEAGAHKRTGSGTPTTSPRRILVVDDNVDAGELLGAALTLAGHTVKVLDEPYEATDAAAEFGAEVVVLDIGMPGLSGYEVAALIRKRLGAATPPLIALTGYGQLADTEKSRAAGFVAHFVKPISSFELRAAIDEICSTKEPS